MPPAGYTKAYLDFCKIGFCLSLLVANLALGLKLFIILKHTEVWEYIAFYKCKDVIFVLTHVRLLIVSASLQLLLLLFVLDTLFKAAYCSKV